MLPDSGHESQIESFDTTMESVAVKEADPMEGIEEAEPAAENTEEAEPAVDNTEVGDDMEVDDDVVDVDMDDAPAQAHPEPLQDAVMHPPTDTDDTDMEAPLDDQDDTDMEAVPDEQTPLAVPIDQQGDSTDVDMSEAQQLSHVPPIVHAPAVQQVQVTQQTASTQPLQPNPQTSVVLQPAVASSSSSKRKADDEDSEDTPVQKKKTKSAPVKQLVWTFKPKPSWIVNAPVPGPNQRRIFRFDGNWNAVGFEFVDKPAAPSYVCVDGASTWGTTSRPGSGRKRTADSHDSHHRGFCTVEILQRAFDSCFVQIDFIKSIIEAIVRSEIKTEELLRKAGEKVGLNQFQRNEIAQFHHALSFEHMVPDLDDPARCKGFSTYVSAQGQLKAAPVTTFASFLAERRCRPSGNGPWSAHDGVQLAMEYLVLRMPMYLVSTHAILRFLEKRLRTYLDAEIRQDFLHTGIGAGHEPHKSLLAMQRTGDPSHTLYSRGYGSHLYRHLQQRLFLWMLRSEPVQHKVVDTRTLRGWAKDVVAECKWNKDGRWHDLWKLVRRDERGNVVMDGNGNPADVFADWNANDAPKTGEELRQWFFAWLHCFVYPKVGRLGVIMECQDERLRQRWLGGCWEVMHQQMDVEITSWLRDFPGWGPDARGAPQAQSKKSALDDIIAQASAPRRR